MDEPQPPAEKPLVDGKAPTRVASLRVAANLTQGQLAKQAKLSLSYISEFETGKHTTARALTLEALAHGLGWPSWDALMGSDVLAPPAGEAALAEDPTIVHLLRVASDMASRMEPHQAIKAVVDAARDELLRWMDSSDQRQVRANSQSYAAAA